MLHFTKNRKSTLTFRGYSNSIEIGFRKFENKSDERRSLMYSNVKAELARKNLSLVDLSNMTGIRYNTLVLKINGHYPLTLDEAKKIKEALKVDLTIDELFERTS